MVVVKTRGNGDKPAEAAKEREWKKFLFIAPPSRFLLHLSRRGELFDTSLTYSCDGVPWIQKSKPPVMTRELLLLKKKGLSVKPGVDESKVYMLRLLLRILLF